MVEGQAAPWSPLMPLMTLPCCRGFSCQCLCVLTYCWWVGWSNCVKTRERERQETEQKRVSKYFFVDILLVADQLYRNLYFPELWYIIIVSTELPSLPAYYLEVEALPGVQMEGLFHRHHVRPVISPDTFLKCLFYLWKVEREHSYPLAQPQVHVRSTAEARDPHLLHGLKEPSYLCCQQGER